MNKVSSLIIMVGLLVGAPSLKGANANSIGLQGTTAALTVNGSRLDIAADIPLGTLAPASNQAVIITPILKNGGDSIALPSMGVFGRNRYYQYLRGASAEIAPEGTAAYRRGQAPEVCHYAQSVDYQPWMDGAQLVLATKTSGCCNRIDETQTDFLAEYHAPVEEIWQPELIFLTPEAEGVKTRSKRAEAYIDFPVNRTEIYPEYRKNPVELNKIYVTVDSVRTDPDATVKQISLTGYASPEGPYDNNVRLSIGRTEALKQHILSLYDFAASTFDTNSVPEDWAGFDRDVATSYLPHKTELLEISHSSLAPDEKERRMKTEYPADWRIILSDIMPALRHTDMVVSYEVIAYTDVHDIERIMRTKPQNLSLEELFLLANSYEPGSPEFIETFEVAVLMFPDDPVSNLNAANAAILAGDYDKARARLAKATPGPARDAAYRALEHN